jgi:hypothetical protein
MPDAEKHDKSGQRQLSRERTGRRNQNSHLHLSEPLSWIVMRIVEGKEPARELLEMSSWKVEPRGLERMQSGSVCGFRIPEAAEANPSERPCYSPGRLGGPAAPETAGQPPGPRQFGRWPDPAAPSDSSSREVGGRRRNASILPGNMHHGPGEAGDSVGRAHAPILAIVRPPSDPRPACHTGQYHNPDASSTRICS